jgi:hypothetical protein
MWKEQYLGDTLCTDCYNETIASLYAILRRDASVGKETRLRAEVTEEPGLDLRQRKAISLSTALRPTESPIQRVPGILSSEVKRPEHAADHSRV